MDKEKIEQILVEYGVSFTDALADRLMKEFKPCDDTISRQAALDIYDDYNVAVENGELEAYRKHRERLLKLPSTQPKTGHWIHFANSDDCSECGWSTGKYISPSKYCPNCGAIMAESDEV